MDMSCGSGLFSRRFVRSGKFEGVVAADFSESMLAQAKQFFEEDRGLDIRSALAATSISSSCSILNGLWTSA